LRKGARASPLLPLAGERSPRHYSGAEIAPECPTPAGVWTGDNYRREICSAFGHIDVPGFTESNSVKPQDVTNPAIGMERTKTQKTVKTLNNSKSDMKAFADDFRRLRKDRGLTQKWVADKCHCSLSLISKWEKGKCSLSDHTIVQLEEIASEIKQLESASTASKTCWICKNSLPLEKFARDLSRGCGLQSKCSQCNIRVANEWREQNREKNQSKKLAAKEERDTRKRLAGCKWVSIDNRSFHELFAICETGELRLEPKNGRVSLTFKNSSGSKRSLNERVLDDLEKMADEIIENTEDLESQDHEYVEDWYVVQGSEIRQLIESGCISKEVAVRLAKQLARR
jgi:transcriptional regulator with XRE-family HTH domain